MEILIHLGLWIGTNENEVLAIYSSYGDADFFKIKSQNLPNEGVLQIRQVRAPFSVPIGSSIAYDNDISMNPLNVHFLDGSVLTIDSLSITILLDLEPTLRFDLSKYKNVDYYSFRSVPIEGYHYLQDSADTIIYTSNKAYQDQANFLTEEEIAQLQIESRVNDFNPTQAITYQTNGFIMLIGTGRSRPTTLLASSTGYSSINMTKNLTQCRQVVGYNSLRMDPCSQLDFLQQFATENNIITVGDTTTPHLLTNWRSPM